MLVSVVVRTKDQAGRLRLVRLSERVIRIVPVSGARTYHLTHRVGWSDPLHDTDWERIFYEAHPCLAVKLMAIFWMSLAEVKTIPPEARITSLPQLDAIVRGGTTIDYDAIRRAHPPTLLCPNLARDAARRLGGWE
jgi:hypothetical protein